MPGSILGKPLQGDIQFADIFPMSGLALGQTCARNYYVSGEFPHVWLHQGNISMSGTKRYSIAREFSNVEGGGRRLII